MESHYCTYCMSPVEPGKPCPVCGLTEGAYTPLPHHLLPGSILLGRYLVGRVLGEGGFGITYIGYDLRLELRVAIKEFFPTDQVTRVAQASNCVTQFTGKMAESFQQGKARFLHEARTMAKMDKRPEIVSVRDFFEENETAYIVMEYVDGTNFKTWVNQRGGGIPPEELFPILEPLFGALSAMHALGLIHRDISPDNLMLEQGAVRLLDFGCAREAASGNTTMTIALKHGYAPIEQYQYRGQGPWTDVYSLCATIYFCLTGKTPPQAIDRMCEDELIPPRQLGVNINEEQEQALLFGMGIRPRRRFQSVDELHAALYRQAPVPGEPSKPAKKWRWQKRWSVPALAGLIAAIALTVILWPRPQQGTDIPETQQQDTQLTEQEETSTPPSPLEDTAQIAGIPTIVAPQDGWTVESLEALAAREDLFQGALEVTDAAAFYEALQNDEIPAVVIGADLELTDWVAQGKPVRIPSGVTVKADTGLSFDWELNTSLLLVEGTLEGRILGHLDGVLYSTGTILSNDFFLDGESVFYNGGTLRNSLYFLMRDDTRVFNQGTLLLIHEATGIGVDLLGAVFSNSGTITLDRYCSMGNGILVSNAGEILVEEHGFIHNWAEILNSGTISLGYGHQLENLGLLRQNGTLKAVDGEALVENRGLVVNTFGEIETKPSAALKFYNQDLIPEELPVAVAADALLTYQDAETACRVDGAITIDGDLTLTSDLYLSQDASLEVTGTLTMGGNIVVCNMGAISAKELRGSHYSYLECIGDLTVEALDLSHGAAYYQEGRLTVETSLSITNGAIFAGFQCDAHLDGAQIQVEQATLLLGAVVHLENAAVQVGTDGFVYITAPLHAQELDYQIAPGGILRLFTCEETWGYGVTIENEGQLILDGYGDAPEAFGGKLMNRGTLVLNCTVLEVLGSIDNQGTIEIQNQGALHIAATGTFTGDETLTEISYDETGREQRREITLEAYLQRET